MQFTNSGGISAAALPTPFDQPGGPGSAAAAAAAAAAAVSAAGHAHPLALHQQQAAAAAAYVAALQAQAAQATAAQDQYTAAMAAAAAEHAYLVCPPPVPQAPLQIMVGKVRPDSDTDFLCLHTDFLCLRACPGLPPCLLGWCGIGCTRHGAGQPAPSPPRMPCLHQPRCLARPPPPPTTPLPCAGLPEPLGAAAGRPDQCHEPAGPCGGSCGMPVCAPSEVWLWLLLVRVAVLRRRRPAFLASTLARRALRAACRCARPPPAPPLRRWRPRPCCPLRPRACCRKRSRRLNW